MNYLNPAHLPRCEAPKAAIERVMPARAPQIPEQIITLGRTADTLGALLDTLLARLEPVSIRTPEVAPSGQSIGLPEGPPQAPMAEALENIQRRLEWQCQLAQRILTELEV